MKKNLETLLLDLLKILLESVESAASNDNSLSEARDTRFYDLQAEIIDRLLFDVENPIFISNKKLKDIFNQVMPHLLSRENRQFLYERLDESGKSVAIVTDYLDRFLNLKPFFLISNLPDNVNLLLSDAMRSYLYGCNRAAVILCGALLEQSLKEKLIASDESLVYKRENGERTAQLQMPIIIDNAISNNVLDVKFEKKAKYTVNKERNSAVHHCKLHNSKETLKIIEAVKAIMENIYERQ